MSKHMEFTNDVRKITDSQLRGSSIIVHNILKSEVDKKIFTNTEYLFQRLESLKTEAKGKLLMLFSGYDDNPEEIYSIFEIRSYMKELFDKYPYMFYYLSQLDMTYKTLFFCLCDVSVVAPVNQNTLKDVIFDNKNISKIEVVFSVPNEIHFKLIDGTLDYAEKIGEKESVIEEITGNLFDNKKGIIDNIEHMNSLKGLPLSEMLEMYEMTARTLWNGLLENFSITTVPEFHAPQFVKQNIETIKTMFNTPRMINYLFIESNQLTNLFFLAKKEPICKECGEKHIIIYKRTLEEITNDTVSFLPSFETYVEKKILPSSQDFMSAPPIPIDTKTDKWICPKCLKMHNFTISKANKISFY